MSSPSRRIFPPSGKKLPAMAPKRVDFPAPLLPMTVTKSPFARARERSSTAFFSWTVPGEKVLETCSRRSKSATLLHLPPEPVKLELLPNRGPGDGGGHNDGGDQLEVLGPHVGGQGGGDDDAVKHRPQDGG